MTRTGRYVVVFAPGNPGGPTTRDLEDRYGFEPTYVYEHALQGFAAELSAEVVEALREDPRVAYVEEDGTAHPYEPGATDE